MKRQIEQGDYILIIDDKDYRYLQIGEVVEVQFYSHSNDVESYRIKFNDNIVVYDYNLEDDCKVLMLER
jgi:hypothetical protein